MKIKEDYVRKIFSWFDLKKIINFPPNKLIDSHHEKNILAIFLHVIITYFLDEISKEPDKYGLRRVLDLVPQYRFTRRGLLQTKITNLDIIYFMNYQDLIYEQNRNDDQKNFFIACEFGLSGEKKLVNKFFKHLRNYIRQRKFNLWYKKACSWLLVQTNYNLLPAEIQKYFHWNKLKLGPKV